MDRRIKDIDEMLNFYILNERIPGINIGLKVREHPVFQKSYGYRQVKPILEKNSIDTIYDIASLTKVISTWPCMILLLQKKCIYLSTQVGEIFEGKVEEGLKRVSVFALLTHTSGLSEITRFDQYGKKKEEILKGVLREGIKYHDNQIRYSNRGFYLLGEIIRIVSGKKLSSYAKDNIWVPLNMKNTLYTPGYHENIAPTEFDSFTNVAKRGIVHDENAELLEGIAGHAGVFSCIKDMCLFCDEIISEESNILDKEWITQSMLPLVANLAEQRGLAWKILRRNQNTLLACHYGFTGTSIWIDVKKKEYVVALSNRVHPTRNNNCMTSIRENMINMFFG